MVVQPSPLLPRVHINGESVHEVTDRSASGPRGRLVAQAFLNCRGDDKRAAQVYWVRETGGPHIARRWWSGGVDGGTWA